MTDLNIELKPVPLETYIEHRSELDVQELLFKVQEASSIGLDYLDLMPVERALIALALLNGADKVPSLSAAINFLQSLGHGEVSQGVFISQPVVNETVTALQESSKVLRRVPGQQALSRRALSASDGIESFLI